MIQKTAAAKIKKLGKQPRKQKMGAWGTVGTRKIQLDVTFQ
jgi:hypothetical protein